MCVCVCVCVCILICILSWLRSNHTQNFNYFQFFSLSNDKSHCRRFQNYYQVQRGKTYQLFPNQDIIIILLFISLSQESHTVCTDLNHHFLILILFCKHFPKQLNFFQIILGATIYFIVWIYHNVVNHSSFRYLMAVSFFCFDK